MIRARLFFASAIFAASTLPAGADPLLELMRSHSTDGPIYSYEMNFRPDTDFTITSRVDPSKPEGERINILTPAESEWPKKFKENLPDLEANTKGDIWCTEFTQNIPDDITKTSETAVDATFAFTPLPDSDADGMERKLMKKVEGSVTLDKQDGAILAVSMHLPEPYKPAMVAKVDVFNMDAKCSRAPDGRTYVEKFDLNLSGSAMMQDFSQRMSREITALLEPVG